MTNYLTKKLAGSEEEQAVSPVIGVILMVAITVILAAVIAAFVLDIGPGETDPTAVVDISGDESDEVTVELTSYDSGNADGVAIVAEQDIDEDNGGGDNIYEEGEVVAVLTTTGAEATVEWEQDDDGEGWEVDGVEDDDAADFTVRAFAGDVGEEDIIGDTAEAQAIEAEFTVEED